MDDIQGDLLRLLNVLYKAPGSELGWSKFIAQFSGMLMAEQGLIVHHDQKHQHTGLANVYNFEQEYINYYEEHYQFINPYLTSDSAVLPKQGSFGLLNETITDEVVKETEFFNDYVLPQGLTVENAIRITPYESEDVHTSIALHYPVGNSGRHIEKAFEICRQIMPHLQTAISLHNRISGMAVKLTALRKSVDKVPCGMILLDRSGRVLVMNTPASNLIQQEDGLDVVDQKLQTMVHRKSEQLNTLIASVQQAAIGKEVGRECGVFRVFRKSGRRPYELIIAPVFAQEDEGGGKDCTVVVFVRDPESEVLSFGPLMQRMYGLTRAEARVTLLLVQGSDTRSIRDQLGISGETLKTHLSRIYRKTQTRRQGELIAAVLRNPSLMCSAGIFN